MTNELQSEIFQLLIRFRRCNCAWRIRRAAVPGPSGMNQNSGGQSSKKMQQTQAQVNEVVDIMRVNVEKVLERDQKLSDLDDRAGALQAGAQQFESTATRLKRKYWWKNLKMWLLLIGVALVIIIIIIVAIVSSTNSSGGGGGGGGGGGSSSASPAPTSAAVSPSG